MIGQAGFGQVTVTPLAEILKAELAHGADAADTRLQYLITATRP